MNVVVDTSVWSLALRKDAPPDNVRTETLKNLLNQGRVFLVGIVLQEILQGIHSLERFEDIKTQMDALPLLDLDRDDYLEAARIWNLCRAEGVQASTTDCQITAACIRHNCALLTADQDFEHIAQHCALQLA